MRFRLLVWVDPTQDEADFLLADLAKAEAAEQEVTLTTAGFTHNIRITNMERID